jgi:hypothetical protein
MTPSLDKLHEALERLDMLVGLYAAPVLRERLASCEDADELAMIVGLVKAYADVVGASSAAFGYVTEESALVIPGRVERELRGLLDRERAWARRDGMREGVVAGFERGVAAGLAHEAVPSPPGTMSMERALAWTERKYPRKAARREEVTVEPHLKMW